MLSMLTCIGELNAGDSRGALVNNPFSKPAILAAPATKTSKPEVPVEEPVQLQLKATLVSDATPLVIVAGEMLGIGEEIDGYRLLAVQEGRAVFSRHGKTHTFALVGRGVDVE